MLTQLDLEMQIHLAQVDSDPLAVIESPHRDRYREFLDPLLYGFRGLCRVCPRDDAQSSTWWIDLRQRAKAGLVAADLLALGVRPQELSQIPLCTSVEVFDTIADAMGWLYVVERRTLLHTVIVKDLTPHMPDLMAGASSYLHCYEHNASTRWRDLSRAFDSRRDARGSGRIVAARIVRSRASTSGFVRFTRAAARLFSTTLLPAIGAEVIDRFVGFRRRTQPHEVMTDRRVCAARSYVLYSPGPSATSTSPRLHRRARRSARVDGPGRRLP